MAQSAPFHTTSYSVFATIPIQVKLIGKKNQRGENIIETASAKILLTEYCKRTFISRKQCYRLIRHRLVAVTKVRGRLYVEEICPEAIPDFLEYGCKPRR